MLHVEGRELAGATSDNAVERPGGIPRGSRVGARGDTGERGGENTGEGDGEDDEDPERKRRGRRARRRGGPAVRGCGGAAAASGSWCGMALQEEREDGKGWRW